jgi:hypothetical protein
MANATAAKLRALAQSLNARPGQRKQLPGIRARAEGRRAHGSETARESLVIGSQ